MWVLDQMQSYCQISGIISTNIFLIIRLNKMGVISRSLFVIHLADGDKEGRQSSGRENAVRSIEIYECYLSIRLERFEHLFD